MTVFSQNESIPKRLLKASDVAKILRCSTSLVYSLIRQGKLKAVEVNSLIRLRPDDVDQYIQQNFKYEV